jgi:hypothetical protein
MRILVEKASELSRVKVILLLLMLFMSIPLHGQTLSLEKVVAPSSVIEKDGKIVTFAIHGYVEFKSLADVFGYIESQMKRWKGKISDEDLQKLQQGLLREGIESRVISMMDERPAEALVTHTSEELREAVAQVREALPEGYAEAFLAVQAKWKHSLNCWSASPVIAGRVLSNWYPIDEGIQLYGAAYDSTEHFWQAAKYHPDLTVGELKELVAQLEARNWIDWFKRLDTDPKSYLPNAYAVEFLRHNLEPEQVWRFLTELDGYGLKPSDHVRQTQQRGAKAFRFSAYEEKVLWGNLADVLHLVFLLSPADDPLRKKIEQAHFDGIYLGERKMGFISEEFRSQMLEIWKVKFLQMARFREVISSIPMEIRLEHFLNDGDSPDIPIPVYVGYLNQIREMAKAKED